VLGPRWDGPANPAGPKHRHPCCPAPPRPILCLMATCAAALPAPLTTHQLGACLVQVRGASGPMGNAWWPLHGPDGLGSAVTWSVPGSSAWSVDNEQRIGLERATMQRIRSERAWPDSVSPGHLSSSSSGGCIAGLFDLRVGGTARARSESSLDRRTSGASCRLQAAVLNMPIRGETLLSS
jgi:hypothetical protein